MEIIKKEPETPKIQQLKAPNIIFMPSCIRYSQTVLAACLHSLQYVKLGVIVTVLSQIIPHQKSVSALLPQSCHAAVAPDLATSLNIILIFNTSLPSPSLHLKIALYCKMQQRIFREKGKTSLQ